MQIPGYEHFEQIGESPVATFWQAFQPDLNRPVDIEFIKPQAILDPAVRAEFLLNVRAAAGVKHAAIAQIFDIREMGTTLAVTREHLTGFSLRQWLRQRGVLKEEKALTIARWVAEGLNFLHAKTGFCHLALSPDFIWLEPTGQVKLCGFGHHVLFEKLGRPMSDFGLLAPEQVDREGPPCSFRTDIYGLGALLYLMTTGRVPFEERPADERPSLILSGQVPAPLLVRRGGTTQAFNQLLSRMMAKNPDERYNNWLGLMQEMDRILDGAKYLIMTRRPALSTIQLPPNGMARVKEEQTAGQKVASENAPWVWAGLGFASSLGVLFVYLLIRLLALPPPDEAGSTPPLSEAVAVLPPSSPPTSVRDRPLEESPFVETPAEAKKDEEPRPRAPAPEPAAEPAGPPPAAVPTEAQAAGQASVAKTALWEELTDEVARRLLRGESQTALMALDLAIRSPEWAGHREKIEELRRIVRRAVDPLGLVLAELNRRQGRRVRVTVAGQARELTVQKVENRRVTFMEEIRAEGAVVHRPLIMEAGDLPPAGLAGLLEAGEGPEFSLARLLLWHRAGQTERARVLVNETGSLATALDRHLKGSGR